MKLINCNCGSEISWTAGLECLTMPLKKGDIQYFAIVCPVCGIRGAVRHTRDQAGSAWNNKMTPEPGK